MTGWRVILGRAPWSLPMLVASVLVVPVGLSRPALAQDAASAQRLFEEGKDQEVIQTAADGASEPALSFLAGQARQRLNQPAEARQAFAQLAAHPEADWKQIGASGTALADGDLGGALAAATAATAAGPENLYAHYQLGLVQARLTDWSGAASAFERAAALDPTFAYAQYYAGLANSRNKRADRTALYLERFLKLAPMAPERPAAESLMRTLRGR